MKTLILALGLVLSTSSFAANRVYVRSISHIDDVLKRFMMARTPTLIFDPSQFQDEETAVQVHDALLFLKNAKVWMFPDGTWFEHQQFEFYVVIVATNFSVEPQRRKELAIRDWFGPRAMQSKEKAVVFEKMAKRKDAIPPEISFFREEIGFLAPVFKSEGLDKFFRTSREVLETFLEMASVPLSCYGELVYLPPPDEE